MRRSVSSHISSLYTNRCCHQSSKKQPVIGRSPDCSLFHSLRVPAKDSLIALLCLDIAPQSFLPFLEQSAPNRPLTFLLICPVIFHMVICKQNVHILAYCVISFSIIALLHTSVLIHPVFASYKDASRIIANVIS